MIKVKIIISIVILISLTKEVKSLGCFRSSSRIDTFPLHDRYCKFDTPYCVKVTEGDYVYRNCDDLNVCVSLGNRCIYGVSYGGKYGELCCCSGDHCNSSAKIFPITNNKYSMLFPLLIFFMIVFVNYNI
uniref:Activin_recp domain-containing protein n=1 Tax=Strongyloides stercoralis TaxID=6248 RepID=A0A0K0ES21_STRER